MRTLETLIDDATRMCTSQADLGRRIGKTASQMSDMRAGREPMSAETVGLLCAVAHIEPNEARHLLALAVIENPKNASRRELFRCAFFTEPELGAETCPADTIKHDIHRRAFEQGTPHGRSTEHGTSLGAARARYRLAGKSTGTIWRACGNRRSAQ